MLFAQEPPPPPPPSVVVCVLDDVSWPDLEKAETPAIDALRKEGLSFLGFHAMPVCSPTRLALWTGRLPRRMGVGEGINHFKAAEDGASTFAQDLRTLPRLMAASGYTTCLVGKWHAGAYVDEESGEIVSERSALDLGGFQYWRAGAPANLRASGDGYDRWQRVDDGETRFEETYATAAQVGAAVEWWRETSGPKFLVVSLSAPHPPIHKPPEDWRRREHGLDRTSRYLEMVESTDLAVEALRAVIGDDTWFFLVSDNGTPNSLNGAGPRGKTTTWDRGIRVPLIVAGPGVTEEVAGTNLEALISCTDLYATVAEIADVDPSTGDGGEDSVSFAAAFCRGSEFTGREFVFSEVYNSNPDNQGQRDELMVRDARWKLRREDGVERLYDLTLLPFERVPLDPAELEGKQREAYERLAGYLRTLPERPPVAPTEDRPLRHRPGSGRRKNR